MTSELDSLRSMEGILAGRVQTEQRRTGEARPHCLAVLLLEQVWADIVEAGCSLA